MEIVDISGKIVSKDADDGGRSLAERAFLHIRRMIYDGTLRPGDRINELDIAQRLGMSRGPVREAIRRMSSSGLVSAEPNLGARVVTLAADDVAQLYDVREALEARAAALAAARMTTAERDALLATLDAHAALMTDEAANAYPRGGWDWDFHLLVLRGARNDVIWRICGDELRDMFSLLRSQHGSNPARGRKALAEHRWIAEAVVAGNGDLAALLMASHIRASRDNLLRVMGAASGASATDLPRAHR
jgi:DNA-binding GntR family transcriptional regulator